MTLLSSQRVQAKLTSANGPWAPTAAHAAVQQRGVRQRGVRQLGVRQLGVRQLGDGDDDDGDNGRISGRVQAPIPSHPGIKYPVRAPSPHSDIVQNNVQKMHTQTNAY